MSREVCGICWCPYDEETGACACEPEPKKQRMTTLREAAKMALEAMLNFPDDISDEMFESITALKAALAEPVQEPYDQTSLELCNVCGWKTLIPGDCCLNCERKHPLGQASTDVPLTVYSVKKAHEP